jgi:DNA-binding NarL/FixJ family response regulator
MIPCLLCRRPIPPTWPTGRLRSFCSRLCANRAKSARITEANRFLDEVAVIRLTSGSPVTSTKAERLAAVDILTTRGLSTAVIAQRLHTTPRSIWRYRAELTRKALAA